VPPSSLASIVISPTELLVEFALWLLIWMPVFAVLEYATHRWIMHKVNRWLDPNLEQLRAHGKHHQGMNHHDLVDVPVRNGLRLTAPVILCVLVWGFFVGPVASIIAPVLALLSWNFIYPYLWNRMHRAIHDLEANWFRRSGPIFRFFSNHHLQHHAQANVNFGTVFPWTDYLFGTRAKGPVGRSRSAARPVTKEGRVDPVSSAPRRSSLLIRGAMKLCEISPTLRTFLWRRWYQYLAGYQVVDWRFMNYGFSDEESEQAPLGLQPDDEANRFAIQLYHRVASARPLNGLDVLEVGCGRGGGASFLQRYHGLRSMTGVDFSQKAVRFCQDHHRLEKLSFITADAEALPFEDESFDAVINVESSHCYRSMPAFLGQVQRVLRPGGHFLFADLRSDSDRERLHENLMESGLTVLECENITPRVLEALNRDSRRKLDIIERAVSPRLLHTFREFAAIEGSAIYLSFRDGHTVYQRYLLQKQPRE
jgi:ubiquinone/menaquinone biosynthesis C-methylase UbiE